MDTLAQAAVPTRHPRPLHAQLASVSRWIHPHNLSLPRLYLLPDFLTSGSLRRLKEATRSQPH